MQNQPLSTKEIAKMNKAFKMLNDAQKIIDELMSNRPYMFLNESAMRDAKHVAQLIDERIAEG